MRQYSLVGSAGCLLRAIHLEIWLISIFGLAVAADVGFADEVISRGSVWDFFDEIEPSRIEAPNDPRFAWYELCYDADMPLYGSWRTGTAPFAFGPIAAFSGETPTLLRGGSASYSTALFRHFFDLTEDEARATQAIASLLCDDGCVGYLNGDEAFRLNVPSDLTGIGAYSGQIGTETFTPVTLTLSTLRPSAGPNLLAVAVFNANSGSSDHGFEMSLSISDPPPPPPPFDNDRGLRMVVESRDLAPATPPTVKFSAMGYPSLNNAGEIAFEGIVEGPCIDDTNRGGIWIQTADEVRNIIRSGTQAPGLGPNIIFRGASDPILNEAGDMAFVGTVSGPGVDSSNEFVLWSSATRVFHKVAQMGDPAPGTPAGVTFAQSPQLAKFQHVRFNNRGESVFLSHLRGPNVLEGRNDSGIWRESGGALELVLRAGDAAPHEPADVRIAHVAFPLLNNAGEVAIVGSVRPEGSQEPAQTRIWVWSDDGVRVVAGDGDPAPGFEPGFTLRIAGPPAFNNSGDVAFGAQVVNPDPFRSPVESLWSETDGGLHLVAIDGMQAPGLPPGATLRGVATHEPFLNGGGDVVFRAAVVGPGGPNTAVLSIWIERDGILQPIAIQGDRAPDTPDGIRFARLSQVDPLLLNDRGQVVFRGELEGPGVTNLNNSGIWATDLDGDVHLVARSGDFVQSNIGVSPILGPSLGSSTGNQDGRATGFNDLGQITFLAGSSVGTPVFVLKSDIVLIPEPTMIALAIAGAVGLFFRRRSWRRVSAGTRAGLDESQ